MYLLFILAFNLFWRLYPCVGVNFDVNIVSLIELDENEDGVLSNTYTQFAKRDWRNTTLFEPLLSNNGYLQMNIERIPSTDALQYTINIRNWPWDNEHNSIEFCFDISISNANNLRFKCSNKVWLHMQQNSIDICHRFYHNELITIAYIYYSINNMQQIQYTTYYSTMDNTLIDNDNNKNNNILLISDSSNSTERTQEYIVWLFGVSITIIFIVCIFVSVICYLTKQGFFDDRPRHSKRKKSTIIIGTMGKGTVSTNSGDTNYTNSLPSSPKKNLRINVTYHSPTPQPQQPQNKAKVPIQLTNIKTDISPRISPKVSPKLNACTYEHSKTQTRTHTKTKTYDTVRIIDALLEGNEEETNDEDSDSDSDSDSHDDNTNDDYNRNSATAITPINNIMPINTGDTCELDPESSLIQYIITCSNNNNNSETNIDTKPSSPVPFI